MRHVLWHRIQRMLASLSATVLVAGGAIIGGLVVAIATAFTMPSFSVPPWIIGALVGGIILLFAHAWADYRQRTYDPTLAFKFDERFNSPEMKNLRRKAAQLLKENRGKLRQRAHEFTDIDYIMDFLSDIAFYQHGRQISPEVVHHTFYYWIRGYYIAAIDYIAACREVEPVWGYLEEMYALTSAIEKKKLRGRSFITLDETAITVFLDDEINLR